MVSSSWWLDGINKVFRRKPSKGGSKRATCRSQMRYKGTAVKYSNSASSGPNFSVQPRKVAKNKRGYYAITYIYAIIIKLILFSEIALLKSSMGFLLLLPLLNLSAVGKLTAVLYLRKIR